MIAPRPLVGVEEEIKPIVRRVAAPPVEVGVLHDQDPAPGDRRPHPAQQSDRLAQVLEQEPRIHRVEAAGLIPVPHVDRPELDVPELAFRGGSPGQAELDLVGVDAYDRATRRDEPGHLQGDRCAPAADIDGAHTRRQPGASE